MKSDFDDPEASYRRGYQQGAYDVIAAISHGLPESQKKALNQWLNGPVYKWRLKNIQGRDLNRTNSNPPSMPPRHLLHIEGQ
jgi:hypothetical protein